MRKDQWGREGLEGGGETTSYDKRAFERWRGKGDWTLTIGSLGSHGAFLMKCRVSGSWGKALSRYGVRQNIGGTWPAKKGGYIGFYRFKTSYSFS